MFIRRTACCNAVAFVVASMTIQVIAVGPALAGVCQTPYLDYSPCSVEAAAIQGTTTTSALSLTIHNLGSQSLFWVIVPTSPGDPSCSIPGFVGRWSSSMPFDGQVPAFMTTAVPVTVGLDANALAPGAYREYACFTHNASGATPVPIPIDFTVFPTACSTLYADHSPCAISLVIAPGDVRTTGLFLTLLNTSAQPYDWTITPTDTADPGCDQAGTGAYFASFVPSNGMVPGATNLNLLVDVNVDASGLGEGTYDEYACLRFDVAGAEPVAIPIELIVANAIFANGFE